MYHQQDGDAVSAFELSYTNLDALVANFYAADEEIQQEFRDLVEATAYDLQDLTRFLAPKLTHYMSEHVHVRFTASKLGFEVGWDAADFFEAGFAFYPFFQEYGTRYLAAQPSLGPAYRQIIPGFKLRAGQVASRALKRSFGK